MFKMARKNHERHIPQGRGRNAQSEKRGKKLKAFRMVFDEDSMVISGAVRNAVDDNEDFPRLREVSGRHAIYVLDPRIVSKEFSSGYRAGFSFANARAKAEERRHDRPDTIIGHIGKVVLIGPKDRGRKVLAAYIESRPLQQERKLLYESLGDAGLRGFDRPQHRNPPSPLMVLGHLERPIHDGKLRAMFTESVEDSLHTHMRAQTVDGVHHKATEFTMGELRVEVAD